MMVKGLSQADGEQANKGGPKPYFALTLLVHDPPYVSTTINFFEWDCTISCSTNEYHEHQETRMIEIEYFCSLLLWTCWSPGLCTTHRHKWVCQVHATHYSIFTTPFNFTFIWRRLELLAFHFWHHDLNPPTFSPYSLQNKHQLYILANHAPWVIISTQNLIFHFEYQITEIAKKVILHL